MDSPTLSREEQLWERFEDQQQELQSLREQKRDKDAAIGFLKNKITTLQNKAGANSPQQGGHTQPYLPPAGEEIQDVLLHRETQIEELELQVARLQQEMRERTQEQEKEVQALRAALARSDEVVAAGGASEVLELRQRLQLRDEQVHSAELAYETLQQHCQIQARSEEGLQEAYEKFKRHKEEELQRSAEQNQRLSASLRWASAEVEDLQRQLNLKTDEVARLADTLQECREKEWRGSPSDDLADADAFVQSRGQAQARPTSAGARPSPRHSPRQPPTPHSPESPMEDGRWSEPERVIPASESDGSGKEPVAAALKERRDTVQQLEEEIHKQIARHRHSLSPQSPGVSSPQFERCPWPMLGSNVAAAAGSPCPAEDRSLTPTRKVDAELEKLSPSRWRHPSDDRPLTPARRGVAAESTRWAEVEPAQLTPSRCLEVSPSLASGSPPPSTLQRSSSSARSPSGARIRAGEARAKPAVVANRSGGAAVPPSALEQEDPAQKRARQQPQLQPPQRVAKQIEQRRRPTATQKPGQVRPDEAWRARSAQTPQGGSLTAPASRGLFRGPERSSVAARPGSPSTTAEASVPAVTPAAGSLAARFAPSSPLIGGSASLPLGGGRGGSASLPLGGGARTALSSARGRLAGSARAPVAADLSKPVVPSVVTGVVVAPAGDGKEETPGKVEPLQGDLHQRFASLRDEMKRQRGPAASVISLGDAGGRQSSVLSDLMQQPEYKSALQVKQRQGLLGGSLRAA